MGRLANSLAEKGAACQNSVEQETYYRCAVSRAYYSAFHHAREYAAQKLNFNKKGYHTGGQSHARLIQHLKTQFDIMLPDEAPKMSNYLQQAKSARENADYDDELKLKKLPRTGDQETIGEFYERFLKLVNTVISTMC